MKKIMFNERYGMQRAAIAGTKPMTRRPVQYKWQTPLTEIFEDCNYDYPEFWKQSDVQFIMYEKAPYKVGEVVAIAQNYKDVREGGYPVDSRYDAFREADWGIGVNGALKGSAGETNKMFVKAEFMPHRILFTDLKVERLQDISDEDCLKEGIRIYTTGIPQCKTQVVGSLEFIPPYGFDDYKHKHFCNFDTPREAFAALIDKVSGRGTWQANHWVFAYTFELVK